MNNRTKLVTGALIAVFAAWGAFPVEGLPAYTVKRATERVVLDGILDEEDWTSASSFGDFVFPWWTAGEQEQTEAKMLWDDTFLYLAFVCRDSHIWADHYDTNSATYNDDTVELFWNPSPDTQNSYYQFEINCIGNLLSVWKNGSSPRPVIMVPHISQRIQGTVNRDSDTDSFWTLEVAIRFSDYPEIAGGKVPAPGDRWRAGLNRCGGHTNPQYSQWSPSNTATPSFHRPDDFGELLFSDEPVRKLTATGEAAREVPAVLEIRGNYPNPFNPSTVIEYTLYRSGTATLEVFNAANQQVRKLADGYHAAGDHMVVWDGKDESGRPSSSGTYIIRLRAGKREGVRKMLLVK